MKIGILLAGYLAEAYEDKYGDFADMFEELLSGRGLAFDRFAVIDGVFPASAHACDGWLVTGSKHGAYEDLPWIARLEEFIREAYAANVPVAGICFGHQIMAQALGGKVVKFPGGWGAGTSEFRVPDGTLTLHALHQDQVIEAPPEAEVIASSDFCAIAGLAYRGSALSFQPHPEFSAELMRDLIEQKFADGMSGERAEAALASLTDAPDSVKLADTLAEFFLSANAARQAAE